MKLLVIVFSIINLQLPNSSWSQKDSTRLKVKNFVNGIIDTAEVYSIKSRTIDWQMIRVTAENLCNFSDKYEDAYTITDSILNIINDGHSLLYVRGRKAFWEENKNYPETSLRTKKIQDNVAYLRIPSMSGNNSEELLDWCKKVRDSLNYCLALKPSLLILDLSRDFGGNMYPMILGLAPIIGYKDTCGYFISNDRQSAWVIRNDSLFFGKNFILAYPNSNPIPEDPSLKIAVIIGKYTISSGEATAIAFRGKKNVTFFGKPTTGATTGNQTFYFDRNSMLFLAVSYYADRNKYLYGKPLQPDYEIECKGCDHDQFDRKTLDYILNYYRLGK
jgi:C-terminal processing protease CtpA/Prc